MYMGFTLDGFRVTQALLAFIIELGSGVCISSYVSFVSVCVMPLNLQLTVTLIWKRKLSRPAANTAFCRLWQWESAPPLTNRNVQVVWLQHALRYEIQEHTS